MSELSGVMAWVWFFVLWFITWGVAWLSGYLVDHNRDHKKRYWGLGGIATTTLLLVASAYYLPISQVDDILVGAVVLVGSVGHLIAVVLLYLDGRQSHHEKSVYEEGRVVPLQ